MFMITNWTSGMDSGSLAFFLISNIRNKANEGYSCFDNLNLPQIVVAIFLPEVKNL